MNGLLGVWFLVVSGILHGVNIVCVAESPIVSTTTPEVAPQELEPECQFHVELDPALPCRRLDEASQQHYSPGQKFCACPAYSECMIRDIPDPANLEHTKTIFICDRDTANDPDWLDMTDGLLRERYRKK